MGFDSVYINNMCQFVSPFAFCCVDLTYITSCYNFMALHTYIHTHIPVHTASFEKVKSKMTALG